MTAEVEGVTLPTGFTLTDQTGTYYLEDHFGLPTTRGAYRSSVIDGAQSCIIPSNNTTPRRGAYTSTGGPGCPNELHYECNTVTWSCIRDGDNAGQAGLTFIAQRSTGGCYSDGTNYEDRWIWNYTVDADTFEPCPDYMGFLFQSCTITHYVFTWPPWSPEPHYSVYDVTTVANPAGKVRLYCGRGPTPGIVGVSGEASVIVNGGFFPDAGGPIGPKADSPAPLIDGIDPTRSVPLGIRGRIGSVYIDGVEVAGSGGEGGMDMAPPLELAGLVPAQEQPEQPKPDPNSPAYWAERHGLGKPCNCGGTNPEVERQRQERIERYRQQPGERGRLR